MRLSGKQRYLPRYGLGLWHFGTGWEINAFEMIPTFHVFLKSRIDNWFESQMKKKKRKKRKEKKQKAKAKKKKKKKVLRRIRTDKHKERGYTCFVYINIIQETKFQSQSRLPLIYSKKFERRKHFLIYPRYVCLGPWHWLGNECLLNDKWYLPFMFSLKVEMIRVSIEKKRKEQKKKRKKEKEKAKK